jgi:uncharacterized protein YgiM (DUF1202 family)
MRLHTMYYSLATGISILAAHALAADVSPYEAVVLDEGAVVRAGPGQRFYVTQELEPGTRVEVYQREAGDWLAIRPPEGSFSWIPEADLEMTEEPGIAEVTSEEAKSWLGSRAERIKQHKSHVSLARGERVEVLGKKQIEGTDGTTQLWLKIAPPAGEFRWVSSRQVRKVKRAELAKKESQQPIREITRTEAEPTVLKPVESAPAEKPRPPRSFIELTDLHPLEPDPAFAVRQAAHEEPVVESPAKSLSPDGFVARKRHPPAADGSQTIPPRLAQSVPRSNTTPRGAASPKLDESIDVATNAEVAQQLEELDVQLSLILSHDKSTWNFGPLKNKVQTIVDTADTPADRGQARFMLDKIKRFEEAFDVRPLPEVQKAPATAARSFRPYDGEGRLTQVKSSDRPAAPYALVDDQGKRICFVTPATGMSITSHLHKRVGLYGKRGMIADLNEPHVLVSRVVDLERLR